MHLTNQIKRLFLIRDYIERHPGCTWEQIQSSLVTDLGDDKGLSYATIKRDIKDLRDNGIKIKHSRTKNGGYHLDEITAEGKLFNRMIESFYMAKANINENILQLESSTIEGKNYLHPILSAIQNKQYIKFTYFDNTNEAYNLHKLAPFLVKEFKRRFYVIGRDSETENIERFSFERISDFEVLLEKCKIEQIPDYFKYCYGIVNYNKKPQVVKLKVTDSKINYFRSSPLHWTQKEIETTKEYSVFEYKLQNTHDLWIEILSHTSHIEVVEPKELIKEVGKRIVKSNNYYNTFNYEE